MNITIYIKYNKLFNKIKYLTKCNKVFNKTYNI